MNRIPSQVGRQRWDDSKARVTAVRRLLFGKSQSDEWETPTALFKLDGFYCFDMDVCASAQNAK